MDCPRPCGPEGRFAAGYRAGSRTAWKGCWRRRRWPPSGRRRIPCRRAFLGCGSGCRWLPAARSRIGPGRTGGQKGLRAPARPAPAESSDIEGRCPGRVRSACRWHRARKRMARRHRPAGPPKRASAAARLLRWPAAGDRSLPVQGTAAPGKGSRPPPALGRSRQRREGRTAAGTGAKR